MKNIKIGLLVCSLLFLISCEKEEKVNKEITGCFENGLIVYQPWMQKKIIERLN